MFTVPLLCTTLAINVVGTLSIVARLMIFRRRTMFLGSRYRHIVAIMVESAVLYSTALICILILSAKDSPVASALLLSLGHIQVRLSSIDFSGVLNSL